MMMMMMMMRWVHRQRVAHTQSVLQQNYRHNRCSHRGSVTLLGTNYVMSRQAISSTTISSSSSSSSKSSSIFIISSPPSPP